MTIVKQATDIHTPSLDQRIVHRYLADFDSAAHIERIRASYGERFRIMDACLRETMPEGYVWTHPEGGRYVFVGRLSRRREHAGPHARSHGP